MNTSAKKKKQKTKMINLINNVRKTAKNYNEIQLEGLVEMGSHANPQTRMVRA